MVAPAEVVTPCHSTLQVVGVCLGGLDSSSSGQKANQTSKATLARRKEAADAGDVKINLSLHMKINYRNAECHQLTIHFIKIK
jgi:hypothetical protein